MSNSGLFDVMCIGAGPEQLPGIRVALAMGLSVIALDGDPAAPGLAAADRGIHVDLRDTEAVVGIAKQAGVRAVIPVPLGSILVAVGAVNDALGLRGVSAKAARLCTDKLAMREALSAAGLPQPTCRVVSGVEDLPRIEKDIGYPLILKPRRGSGSRGVWLCSGREEAARGIASSGALPRQGGLLVESVIPGVEYGVDGVVVGRDFRLLAVRTKEMTAPPYRVALGYAGPMAVTGATGDRIAAALRAACTALGIEDALLHADIMIDGDDTVGIIELSARPSGYGLSQVLLPHTTGIQPTREALRMLLGEEFSFEPTRSAVGVYRTLPRASRALGDDAARIAALPGVVEFVCDSKRVDDAPITSGADAYRCGHPIIVGDTMDDVETVWACIETMVMREGPDR